MNLLAAALLTRQTIPMVGGTTADPYATVIEAIADRVSWWRFGETAGADVAIDEDGVSNGLYQGGVTLGQTALPGNTDDTDVLLDGTSGFVEVTDHANYHIANGTIAVWFKLSSLAVDRWIISKDVGGLANGDLGFWYRASDDTLRFQMEDATTIYRALTPGGLLPTGVITANTTYCTLLSFGAAGMKLYMASGGSLQLIASNTYTGGISASTRNWRFGASQFSGTATDFMAGTLGDVIVWSRQLSVAEMEAVAQVGASPPASVNEEILLRSPTLYWPLTGVAATDTSPNGLNGTINGTPAGTGAGGMDLGGTADISLAHSTMFETDPAPTTVDRDSFSEVGATAEITVNTLADNTALFSKCDNTDDFALGWYAEAMANGAVRCHFVSHRFNDLVIDAPAGTITQGVEFSIWMGLGYQGAWAAINGQMLWSGYKCPLHWYGDDHRVRDIAAAGRNHGGSRKVNTSAVRIGKIGAAGARGDITVRHFALFYRATKASQMTLADAQAIAGASGAALPHPIWGASLSNVANGASAATVQSAIDARSTAGGGTVRLAATGAYTWSSAVTVKGNVLLDLNGSTVTMSGASLFVGATASISAISDNGGDVAAGGTSITGSNIAAACSVGDSLALIQSQFISAFSYNGSDTNERVSEIVEVKSISGTTVNFKHPVVFPYSSANRSAFRTATGDASLFRWTPPRNMGVINGTVTKSGDQPLIMNNGTNVLLADLNVRQTSTATANYNATRLRQTINLWSPRGLTFRNMATELGGSWHVYTFVVAGYARGCVFHGMEVYGGGIPGWHAISHSTGNVLPGVDSKAITVEMEYVNCHADCAARDQQWDTHFTSARTRWIDCSNKKTATGVAGTAGTPGGGGVVLDGYQHELLRFSVPNVGKDNHFRGQGGMGMCYCRETHQPHPTETIYWFTGGAPIKNSTTVNVTRADTGAPWDPTLMSNQGGNVWVNVSNPHP